MKAYYMRLPENLNVVGPFYSADTDWAAAQRIAAKQNDQYTNLPDEFLSSLSPEEREQGPRACWLVHNG